MKRKNRLNQKFINHQGLIAEIYKDKISTSVYNSLINYQVEITD